MRYECKSVGGGMDGECKGMFELKNFIDFICKQIANDFDCPYNFSQLDEFLLENERFCGKNFKLDKNGGCDSWLCWKKYFELKYLQNSPNSLDKTVIAW